MTNILVIGRNGQLARGLADRVQAHPGLSLEFLARPDIDMEQPEGLAESIAGFEPDLVINAAAYTAVDKAESEPEIAQTVNAVAAGEIALGAAKADVPIIHVSTDYVFDGSGTNARGEADIVGPVGVYGKTKLEGEKRVEASNARHVIARTAWVYSPWGNNFLKTMMRLAEDREELGVVDDQIGNPTSAQDLAEALLKIAEQISHPEFAEWGVYHVAGSGTASWREFAAAIFEMRERLGLARPTLTGLTTDQYPTPARRPYNSRLKLDKLESVFGVRMPFWRDSVQAVVRSVVSS